LDRLLLAVFFFFFADAEGFFDVWAFEVCAAWVLDGFVEVAADAVVVPTMPAVATESPVTATTK
jgi:hypothetical protein